VTPRIAVVTARYGNPWDELSVLAARTAGALACAADVDVLVAAPGERVGAVRFDGACRVLRFPATPLEPRRRAAWRQVALGVSDEDHPGECTCPTDLSRRSLPPLVEEQLVLAEGGDSPALYEYLAGTPYEVTVFVGLHSPVSCFGAQALPDGRRAAVVPGAYEAARLAVHDSVLDRVERVLVCTEAERGRFVQRVGPSMAERVENVGMIVGVNAVVRSMWPTHQAERFLVVARDWQARASLQHLRRWEEALIRCLPEGMGLRLVGPGASALRSGVPHSDNRIDAWWWVSRALAVIDPVPHRVLGQEVLESLMLGVPVIVAADGGATREHAEVGNGGLWYRVNDELIASVEEIAGEDVRASLVEQGRAYAVSRFGDTDTYVKRLTEALLG